MVGAQIPEPAFVSDPVDDAHHQVVVEEIQRPGVVLGHQTVCGGDRIVVVAQVHGGHRRAQRGVDVLPRLTVHDDEP